MGTVVGVMVFFVALAVIAFVVETAIDLGYTRAVNDKMEGKWDE
jgi:hypothetical protein